MRELASFAVEYRGHSFRKILNEAKKRRITVQAMLRAVVIPEWLEMEKAKGKPTNEQINTS